MNAKTRPLFAIISTILVMIVAPSAVFGQESLSLTPHVEVGSETEVIVQMDVKGSLQILEAGKPVNIPLAVNADLRYREMRQPTNGSVLAALRKYSKTEAAINVDGSAIQPQLRSARQRIRVESGTTTDLYSVDGALTREELDLVDIQGNTLLLDQLLTDKVTTVGDSWTHHDQLLASMLSIDAVSVNEVESKLVSIDTDGAIVELSGRVEGAIHGVSTEIEVGGKYLFDTANKRVTKCQLTLKEKRSIGHVGPGITADSTINILIVPQTDTQMRNLISLGSVASAHRHMDLECQTDAGFSISYDRRWHVMDQADSKISLRMVDRGDLIAQAQVSLMQSSAGAITSAGFRNQIRTALGDKAKNVTSQGALQTKSGLNVAGITANGVVSGLPIEWRYYLIGDKVGQQVAIVFTLEPELAPKLGTADRKMVESFRWTTQGAAAQGPVGAIR